MGSPEGHPGEVCPEAWEDLTVGYFDQFPNGGVPIFLDPEGFRFCLPALMRHQVRERSAVDISGWFFCLTHGSPEQATKRDALSEPQRAVTRAWYRYLLLPDQLWCVSTEDVNRALARLG